MYTVDTINYSIPNKNTKIENPEKNKKIPLD